MERERLNFSLCGLSSLVFLSFQTKSIFLFLTTDPSAISTISLCAVMHHECQLLMFSLLGGFRVNANLNILFFRPECNHYGSMNVTHLQGPKKNWGNFSFHSQRRSSRFFLPCTDFSACSKIKTQLDLHIPDQIRAMVYWRNKGDKSSYPRKIKEQQNGN